MAALRPDRAPTILFLSAEPYVPWELALVDPPLDPTLPPFLSGPGDRRSVGAWSATPAAAPADEPDCRRPRRRLGCPPLPGWQRLDDAEAEAADLVRRSRGDPGGRHTIGILDLFRGRPAADVIHFAVHGTYDADQATASSSSTARPSTPLVVLGTPLHGHPFVFLNACQVARGDQLLGDQAGLAAAFLSAGASAVIAPLW